MSHAAAHSALQQALQHHQAGRLGPAAALYAQMRKLQPAHFDAHHLGGMVALQQGKFSEAMTLLRRAIELRGNSAQSWMCLGLAQAQLGQFVEAEKSLQTGARLDAKNFELWSNLASVLVRLGKLDEAAEAYERSAKLNPKFAQAWTGLGSVRQLQGRSKEAVQLHTRALEIEPRHAKAQCARAQAWQSLHRVEDALADFEKHLSRVPDDVEAASLRLYLLNYSAEISREQLFEEHRRFGARFPKPAPLLRTPSSPSRQKLRVAFLSPDLRSHSVAYFLEPLLQHVDRDAIEIYLYHDHYCVDAVSQRLANHARIWRNFVGQSHDAVETQIRADQPDVLFDLAGHTGLNRLPVFARRVAPVQISYLGYPATTGLAEMDFRFTDEVADPIGEGEHFHTEKLIRFAPTGWAYAPPADAPEPAVPPYSKNGYITFGSFNALAKANPATLQLWAKVLAAVPESRLVLKSASNADEAFLRQRSSAAGIPNERLELLPSAATTADHLAAYSRVDLCLDPFPYSGTTTTCEALWMGVPVVTLSGNRHAARVGASILKAIGRAEWVAYEESEYVGIVLQLAEHRDGLEQIRRGLRNQMRASALLDHATQARRFGEAIESCVTQQRQTIG